MSARYFLLAAIIGSTVGLHAQVTARQGELETHRFRSPMIVEIPFPFTDPSTWTNKPSAAPPELYDYFCEGVSFERFTTTIDPTVRDGRVIATFDIAMKNEPGADKMASVVFEIVGTGDEVFAKGAHGGISVEEGKVSRRRVRVGIPSDTLKSAGETMLRLTVVVAVNP